MLAYNHSIGILAFDSLILNPCKRTGNDQSQVALDVVALTTSSQIMRYLVLLSLLDNLI